MLLLDAEHLKKRNALCRAQKQPDTPLLKQLDQLGEAGECGGVDAVDSAALHDDDLWDLGRKTHHGSLVTSKSTRPKSIQPSRQRFRWVNKTYRPMVDFGMHMGATCHSKQAFFEVRTIHKIKRRVETEDLHFLDLHGRVPSH